MAVWTFKQRGTRADLKTLTLNDYNAPFGRARKNGVIKEEITVGIQTTNYPGAKAPPTRHIFGSYWEPTVIKGRWMTKMQSRADVTAGQIADDWLVFVRDEMPLTVSWGNIASWEGFISKLSLDREDEDNIAWEMTVLLDRRTDLTFATDNNERQDTGKMIYDFIVGVKPVVTPPYENVAFDVFQILDNYIGLVKSYTAQLVDFANLTDSIEKQSFSTVQSFRGILANIESALTEIQLVVANGVTDSVLLVRRTESDLQWYKYCLTSDVAITNLKAIMSEIDRTLEASIIAVNTRFVQAINDDTWESISSRACGSPDRAGSIREENGIKYGTLPVAGESYIVSNG